MNETTGDPTSTLGKDSGIIRLRIIDDFKGAVRGMSAQAGRQLDIFTFDLDPPLYGDTSFVEAAKKLVLSSPHSRIRILLQNNERSQKDGHRLVDLMRRLPSRIEIRRTHPDYLDHGENFMVVDSTGYIKRTQHGRYEGEADYNNPRTSGNYLELFNSIWVRSEQDSALRRLDM
ncbi:MAG: acyltransferase [Gammaproteobacteria bacterium]|nr:acyltransferase [Gammaproteobacteria bacterium]